MVEGVRVQRLDIDAAEVPLLPDRHNVLPPHRIATDAIPRIGLKDWHKASDAL